MKLPVEWLRDFVDFACSTDELADALTMAGLEVEEIIRFTPDQMARLGGNTDSDSYVFDVKITPNRGDCLSILGISREIAAILQTSFKFTEPVAKGTPPTTASVIKISINDPDLCRRYAGGLVRNVVIKDSPDWMKNRLILAGMRPINNVVDITNYVMLEYGQPLHAFDHSFLRGAEIIARRAKAGETMQTLDGVDRALDSEMLVIADRDRAVAIAGVMGGAESEVGGATRDILIESANFDPVSVRRTSKVLNLSTESSYRFERGVDPFVTVLALKRAAELMRDLAEGEIADGVVDIYPSEIKPLVINVRPERVNRILGSDIQTADMARFLRLLDMQVEAGELLDVTVPTCRTDITQEIDLIEEIARMSGFDKINSTLPATPSQGTEHAAGRFEDEAKQALMRRGAQEVLTNSLVDPWLVEQTGLSQYGLAIRNPLSEDLSRLRIMLIPNLLQVLSRNSAFGEQDLSVFEVGRTYSRAADGSISQERSVAGAMTGSQWASAWNLDKKALAADFYLCKGLVESFLDALDITDRQFAPCSSELLHPSRAAVVRVSGVDLGIMGEVAPALQEKFDLRSRAYVFELDFETLRKLAGRKARGYRPLARYPAVYRDVSIVLDAETSFADVKRTVVETGGELVESVDLQEVYVGPQLGPGKKSLLLSIEFRSAERTLTDQAINDILGRITDGLIGKLSAAIRGG